MCDLVFSLQEFLKILPGIAIFPLSFYLAWKKIGYNVSCATTMGSNKITAPRISTVTLTNHKDRPVTIFAIQAVIEKDITYTLDEFDPPMILKALETVTITTSHYSSLMIGDAKWEPEFVLPQQVEIFLITDSKVIKCKMICHPSLNRIHHFDIYMPVSKITKKFNGVVYNENAKFAITYTYKNDSSIKTAIVDVSGFITNDWNYRYNMIPHENMQSVAGVIDFLKSAKAENAFNIYGVDELQRF